MQLIDTAEHRSLREAVQGFLAGGRSGAETAPTSRYAGDFDRAAWTRMARELGLQGIAIPEQYGGSGYSPVERSIVLQELGRVLYNGPYFSTVVFAAELISALGDTAAQEDYLPRIADGSLTAAVAPLGSGHVTATRTTSDGGWSLDGELPAVLDATTAGIVLVPADTGAGIGIFTVDPAGDGVVRSAQHPLDLTRGIAALTLSTAPGRLIGDPDAAEPFSRAMDHALAGLAAEQLGGAQACLDMAVEYAKTRVQFGRPIGSFQAVKHKCADLAMQVEFAHAASAYASWALAEDPGDAALAAAMAKSYCSGVFMRAAADNIQIHGGIGFTWEHPAHLYLRRAKSTQLYLGAPPEQRVRIAAALSL